MPGYAPPASAPRPPQAVPSVRSPRPRPATDRGGRPGTAGALLHRLPNVTSHPPYNICKRPLPDITRIRLSYDRDPKYLTGSDLKYRERANSYYLHLHELTGIDGPIGPQLELTDTRLTPPPDHHHLTTDMAATQSDARPNGHTDFDTIPSAIESFCKFLYKTRSCTPLKNQILTHRSLPRNTAQGNFVIVLDSPSRENEGDLVISAAHLTASKAAFMIRYTSGYLCAPMPGSLADALDLPAMVALASNADARRTCYTVSVDAVGSGTGISAVDRARTCNALAGAQARPESFVRPGHILPLRAVDGGVCERQGHTEATVELCRLAGLREVGVIGELVEEGEDSGAGALGERSGTGMMRRNECLAFGRKYGIRVITIEDLVGYVRSQAAGKAG